MIDDLKAKLASINEYLANKGIVFPFLRDNGRPSVSLTLLMLSFIYWSLAVLDIIKDLDIDKIENGMWAMSALYFSRKITKDGKGKVEIDQSTKQGEDTSAAAK